MRPGTRAHGADPGRDGLLVDAEHSRSRERAERVQLVETPAQLQVVGVERLGPTSASAAKPNVVTSSSSVGEAPTIVVVDVDDRMHVRQ